MNLERVRQALRARVEARADDRSSSATPLERESAACFLEADWPGTRRPEAWRFTDLRALDALDWERPDAAATAPRALGDVLPHALAEADCLFFLDGRPVPALSVSGPLPSGVRIGALDRGAATENVPGPSLGSLVDLKTRPLSALNSALHESVACVSIPEGIELERPIAIVWLTSGSVRLVNPRTSIHLAARSRAQVIEHHVAYGPEGALVNPVTEVHLEAGAVLDHVHLQEQAGASVHLAELAVRQQAESRLGSHSLALGSALARLEIRTELAGEEAHARLHGLYRGLDRQLLDHHTAIDHASPHTTSEEVYKGILDSRAKGVFCGLVHVRPHAQKIDASQTNRALLLTDHATVHTRPQLEIYADDVRCSHGASIGQLDDDALFYLRARGIGESDARAMLTAAFVEEVLESLAVPGLADHVRSRLRPEETA